MAVAVSEAFLETLQTVLLVHSSHVHIYPHNITQWPLSSRSRPSHE